MTDTMDDDRHCGMEADTDVERPSGHPVGAEFGANIDSTLHAEPGPSSTPSSSSTSSDSSATPGSKSRQRICACQYCTRSETRLDVASVSDAGLRYDAAADRRNNLAPAAYADDDDDDGIYLSRQQPEDESRAHDLARARNSQDLSAMASLCFFLQDLPVELIDNILSYLSPLDLAAVSQTCRFLYLQASQDLHWQALVQANVPGITLNSPHPFASFRELYAAHDPRWFLPKYKIWFSGRDLTGRLIMVRFNPSTGGIEGHQMVAISNRTTYHHWPTNKQVIIHSFDPEVRLHMHKPVINLPAHSFSASEQPLTETDDNGTPAIPSRFAAETTMRHSFDAAGMFSNFMLSRALPRDIATSRSRQLFPYGHIWPPPSVPARHRIAQIESDELEQLERPTRRVDICDQGFHVHTWLEMGDSGRARGNPLTGMPSSLNLSGRSNGSGRRIGEEVSTYSTLAPWTYTPTEDKLWRGIWVGDYSGHGCEFLLVHQPEDAAHDVPPALERRADETDEEFERRQWEARVYRGRLEAVKLTGDPNIPRGEYTFVADDLGEDGFVNVVTEEPFAGARVVRSRGHVAHSGFVDDKFIESHLLLISPNRLAQYWVGFGHISFFERVDIDQFLWA